MRYWDTSALVPLVIEEARSPETKRLAREDPMMTTWWGTQVEMVSAVARQQREGRLDAAATAVAMRSLDDLARAWTEVEPGAGVRRTAGRLVRVHPLRAADAFQLAAAVVAAAGSPDSMPFVTLDERLAEAASKEGFPIVRPEATETGPTETGPTETAAT